MFTETEIKIDRLLLFCVISLSAIGVVMVYSSTAILTVVQSEKPFTLTLLTNNTGNQFLYLKRHLFALFVSLFSMISFYMIKPYYLRKLVYPLLFLSLGLLLAVFIPSIGVEVNEARRWIRLGYASFQPSELVKLAMVFFVAKYISIEHSNFKKFFMPIFVMLVIQAILLLQPDFGGAVTLGIITISMFYIAGIPLKYLLVLFLFLSPVVGLLLKEPYRLKRIMSFLDPWQDPYGDGFQLIQSLIALGRGGLSGVGLGNSQQKLNFLPESSTDFIFSLLGEEMGFIGVLVILGLYFLLFIRGIKITMLKKSYFHRYLAFGLTLMLTLQALINIAVCVGLLPTKGLPLPFISYGGSSLLVNFIAVGVLLRLSKNEPEQSSYRTAYTIKRKRGEGFMKKEEDKIYRVVIAGGGTGGHLYPALATAEELKERFPEVEILFIGSYKGIEAKVVPMEGYLIRFLNVEGFVGKSLFGKFLSLYKFLKGIKESYKYLQQMRPDIVIGSGSYVSFAPVFSAWLMRIPTLILEQNAIPGKANKLLAKVADAICVTWEESIKYFPRYKVYLTGNPIRKKLLQGSKENGIKLFSLKENLFTVSIFGGSLGSHSINTAMVEALQWLVELKDKIQFLHQSGNKDYEFLRKKYREYGFYAIVTPFIYQMNEFYAVSDIVICRAGASTIAEICATGKPSIMIPYPYATSSHQLKNALRLEAVGASIVIKDEYLNGKILAENIKKLFYNKKLRNEMSKKLIGYAKLDAAAKIIDITLSIVKRKCLNITE